MLGGFLKGALGGVSSPAGANANGTEGPGTFAPSTYGTVLGWYDFTDGTKVLNGSDVAAANNDVIKTIQDKSGSSRHGTQPTSGARPTFKTSIVNSLSVARFDNSNDFIQLDSSKAITNGITGFTAAVVYSCADIVTETNGFFEFQTGTAGRRLSLLTLTNGQYMQEARRLDASGGDARYGGSHTASTWYIAFAIWDFSAGTSKVYQNGNVAITSGTNDTSGTVSATDSLESPTIGSMGLYGSTLFNGDIAEVVFWNGAMSDGNRDSAETSLGSKYGITVT